MTKKKQKRIRLTREQIKGKLALLQREQIMSATAAKDRLDTLRKFGCPDDLIVAHMNDLLNDMGLPKPPVSARKYMRQIMEILGSPLPPPSIK